jgi:hypothetical protein
MARRLAVLVATPFASRGDVDGWSSALTVVMIRAAATKGNRIALYIRVRAAMPAGLVVREP